VNSDLEPNAAETNTVIAQAAPFGQVCRLFVPVYRQLTVSALTTGHFTDAAGVATAYGDVVAAWEYYMEHDNQGRGFVLIGHSQGASVLKRLIAEHIDGEPAVRSRLVSAILAGTAVSVPRGKDVGGDFENIPACRTSTQRGCVVVYSTFNADSPPPALSLFGRVAGINNEALCVNPAAPARGETGELSFWLAASSFRNFATSGPAAAVRPTSGYGVADGLIDAKCTTSGQFSYLEVKLNAAGSALGLSLPAFLTGEVWGLHILDMSLTMGNLVELVRAEGGGG
jgi:pimeloyl-ACP methyl ester carboxylesterase